MPSENEVSLLISAWRRPRYLRKTLESWTQVPEVKTLRRIIFAVGRSHKQDEVVDVIKEMAKRLGPDVEIRPDSDAAFAQPGMHTALGEAMRAAFADDPGLNFLVCSEEDIVVSSDVLRYMDWARSLRKDHPDLLVVEAHNQLGQGWHPADVYDEDAEQHVARLVRQFHPWCWGTWRDRWENVLEPNWDWACNTGTRGFDNGYDWQINRIIERGYTAVAPDASRSQNIGRFEGVYANPALFQQTQAASYLPVRDQVAYQLV
jgi:hypothetical protein